MPLNVSNLRYNIYQRMIIEDIGNIINGALEVFSSVNIVFECILIWPLSKTVEVNNRIAFQNRTTIDNA